MKALIPGMLFVVALALDTSADGITSTAYPWREPVVVPDKLSQPVLLFEGESTHLAWLRMEALALDANGSSATLTVPDAEEHLILMKDGQVTARVSGVEREMGRGGIIMLMPGVSFELANSGDLPATFYRMSYRSKSAPDLNRVQREGGSFVIRWEDLNFRPHAQGGRRDYFDHPTAMCEDFEMHVTTLNPHIWSHPPHRHVVEEIILMIEGESEEQIGEGRHRMSAGDMVFIDSNVEHTIRNVGDAPCIYFAFQWK